MLDLISECVAGAGQMENPITLFCMRLIFISLEMREENAKGIFYSSK